MLILLTNDDGIYAEGIQILGEKLLGDEAIDLYIVAPEHEQSATGHSITMHRPLRTEAAKFYHNPDLKGWSVNGTPADCVKLAIEYLLPRKPDLVISGINNGSNLGSDILYSGTVSAAIEAIILGVPALAVSLTEQESADFHFAADFTLNLVGVIEENDLPKSTLLNINIPGTKSSEIAGIAVTRQGTRQYRNAFQERTDPRGKNYFWLAGEVVDTFEDDEDTDVAAIHKSFISITPIHFDLTNFKLLDRLKAIQWRL